MTNDKHIVSIILTGGNVSDITPANNLIEGITDCYIVEDKGYDSDEHRDYIRSSNNIPVIPGRKNRKESVTYNKKIYKLRRNIEIFFGRIKENKRLAMRYDKDDITFLSFFAIASLKIFLNLIIS